MITVLELLFYLGFLLLLYPRYAPLQAPDRSAILTRANRLRGVFALEIIVGHAVQNTEAKLLIPMEKLMICSVAFFFFVSAAGLALSAGKSKNYLRARFLLEKPVYMFLLILFIYLVERLADLLVPGAAGTQSPRLIADLFLRSGWFLWELILFYLLFFVVYRFLPAHRVPVCAVITLVIAAVFYFIGLEECWYASALGFPLGLLFAEYKSDGFVGKILTRFGTKARLFLLIPILPLTVFGLLSLDLPQQTVTTMLLMRNSICIAVLLLLVLVLYSFSLGESAVSRFLGIYSAELYFFQFLWLRITLLLKCHYLLRILLVIAATLITAILLHPVTSLIKKACSGRPVRQSGRG